MPFYTSTPGGHKSKPATQQPDSLADQMEENPFADNKNYVELNQKLADTNAALQRLQKQFEKYQQEMISTNKLVFLINKQCTMLI